jgi:hypothetical protein
MAFDLCPVESLAKTLGLLFVHESMRSRHSAESQSEEWV